MTEAKACQRRVSTAATATSLAWEPGTLAVSGAGTKPYLFILSALS